MYDRNYRHNLLVDEASKLYTLLGKNREVKVNSIHNVMIKDSDLITLILLPMI